MCCRLAGHRRRQLPSSPNWTSTCCSLRIPGLLAARLARRPSGTRTLSTPARGRLTHAAIASATALARSLISVARLRWLRRAMPWPRSTPRCQCRMPNSSLSPTKTKQITTRRAFCVHHPSCLLLGTPVRPLRLRPHHRHLHLLRHLLRPGLLLPLQSQAPIQP